MKITKQKLKTIIQEEIKSILNEKLKEKYHGASEGMEFEDAIKLATKLKLRMVYGTRTEQWHVANEKNLDWGTAIDPKDGKIWGEKKSRKMHLSPSFVRPSASKD